MRPHSETQCSLWLARVLPLAVGCVFGTAWGSNPDNTIVLSSSTFSHSETQHHRYPPGARHHPPPVAIYRSPAPLRGGHGEFFPLTTCLERCFRQLTKVPENKN